MLLKEFDLDIPSLEKNERHLFRSQVRCIAAHYQRHFPNRFHTPDFWKILVECSETESTEQNTYLGVRVVKVAFNYSEYKSQNTLERKIQILKTLHKGVLKVAEHFDFNDELFTTCFKSVVAQEYDNQWVWKKPKSNSSRTLKAQVLCLHDMEKFTAILQITDKNGKILHQNVAFKAEPDEFMFARKLGSLKWTSSNEIVLYDKAEQVISKKSF